jgi:ATP phosphoribosyltransferase
VIRLALPSKGRLRDPSLALLARVGIAFTTGITERGLVIESRCGRYRILSVHARDIPYLLASGAADCAITGTDLIAEAGVDLPIPLLLEFGRARLVLAVPETSPVSAPADLDDGVRIATVYPRLTQEYLRGLDRSFRLVSVSGSVEAAPALGVADAIVDVMETGTTLKSNRLRPVATLQSSQAGFVVAPHLSGELRNATDELALALQSVTRAERCRYLMANVPVALLPELPALLPGVEGPTILHLLGKEDWVAVHAVVEADEVNGVVAMLKRGGATGILIAGLERMVL